MGASGWHYHVPYRADLQAALDDLRRATFAEGDYYWPYEGHGEPRPRPSTVEDLFADEWIQECGTHSVLDVHRVIGPADASESGTVKPIAADEAYHHTGRMRLRRADKESVDEIVEMTVRGWAGRCAILHDAAGEPVEIYFSGISGD